jgi:hypothetical protein
MSTLLTRYTEFVERAKASRTPLVKFSCPACSQGIETIPAPKGVVWDSLTTCPHCEAMFMKVISGISVEATLPLGGVMRNKPLYRAELSVYDGESKQKRDGSGEK